MKLLLTSAGIKNRSIRDALVDLLGKPIAESNALCIPTAIYAFPGGAGFAWKLISGRAASPLCELGWKSLGVLELTALPSIETEHWTAAVEESDALLVGGGDPLYLCYWILQSGLVDLLPSLHETVWVGVSGGSLVMGPASAKNSSTGVRPPPVPTEHWGWLTLRCFRTWITRICRTIPWPTQRNGPSACRCRRTRLMIRPPSK